MSKKSVFRKQLYERVCKEQSSSQVLRGVLRVSLKKLIRGVSSRRQFYEKDIAVGSQCEVKPLRVRQCVIICESDR
jgi:hypothetical protein